MVTWIQQGARRHERPALSPASSPTTTRRSRSYPGKHQAAAAADGGRSRRQGRLRADGRVLVARDPEEREEQEASPGSSSARSPRRPGTTAMALNGNGPTRISTYADPKLKAVSPFAADEAKARRGTPHPPAGLRRAGPRPRHLHRGNAGRRARHEAAASRDGRRGRSACSRCSAEAMAASGGASQHGRAAECELPCPSRRPAG